MILDLNDYSIEMMDFSIFPNLFVLYDKLIEKNKGVGLFYAGK